MTNESTGSMDATVASEHKHSFPSVTSVVTVAMALWLGATLLLGLRGAFVGSAGSPPLPIFFGFATPLAVFITAYFGWGAFRAFVLKADLRLMAAIQGWRWAGLGFLTLYAHGVLPGLFAFPAGLGDMAIGFTAPCMVLRLIAHQPEPKQEFIRFLDPLRG